MPAGCVLMRPYPARTAHLQRLMGKTTRRNGSPREMTGCAKLIIIALCSQQTPMLFGYAFQGTAGKQAAAWT